MIKTAAAAFALLVTATPAMSASQAAPAVEANMQQWLGTLTLARLELLDLAKWSADDSRIGGEHFAYWKQLRERGLVVLVGRTIEQDSNGHLAPDTVGLVIFDASDRAAAEAIIKADPGVQNGICKYRLQPYRVALKR